MARLTHSVREMKLSLLLLLSLVLLAPINAAGQVVDSDLATRARAATQVVVGRVVDVASRMGTNASGDRLIYSDLLIEVSETLKGTPAGTVTVTLEGGEANGLILKVSDMPQMRSGDRAVYFLTHSARGEWVPVDRGRGVARLDAANRLEGGQLSLTEARKLILSSR